ncbi:MAG: hypothetical protein M1829_005492 [Trizodia sp. TS-e1964]|nr:MAG: hypothetical protein M1829_005492 [Trizodia sp. TS-e1964]
MATITTTIGSSVFTAAPAPAGSSIFDLFDSVGGYLGQTTFPSTLSLYTGPASSSIASSASSISSASSTSSASSASSASSTTSSVSSSLSTTSSDTITTAPSSTLSSSFTSTLSSSGSTTIPTPLGAGSNSTAGNSTITQSSTSDSGSSNTGFIAAVAVLAVLFVVSLLAFLFLLYLQRNRRREAAERAAQPYTDNENVTERTALTSKVASLEAALAERDSALKSNQAAALTSRRLGASAHTLNDRGVHDRFLALSKAINDWVLGHFQHMQTPAIIPTDLAQVLGACAPGWQDLLANDRSKYHVISAVVGQALRDAFSSGEFLGSQAYSALQATVAARATPAELSEWRCQTMQHLATAPNFDASFNKACRAVITRIEALTEPFAVPGNEARRLAHLAQIVDAAGALAVELAQCRAGFVMGKEVAGGLFVGQAMTDVLQDGHNLEGRPVAAVVFPSVTRFGDQEGRGWERGGVVVLKARVLV